MHIIYSYEASDIEPSMYIHEDVCITMICISYVVMLVGRDTKLFEGLGVLADDNLLVVATYHI